MSNSMLIKKTVNLELITRILQELKIGILMEEVCPKSIKLLLPVQTKSPITTASSAFRAIYHCIGAWLQTCVKNAKKDSHLI